MIKPARWQPLFAQRPKARIGQLPERSCTRYRHLRGGRRPGQDLPRSRHLATKLNAELRIIDMRPGRSHVAGIGEICNGLEAVDAHSSHHACPGDHCSRCAPRIIGNRLGATQRLMHWPVLLLTRRARSPTCEPTERRRVHLANGPRAGTRVRSHHQRCSGSTTGGLRALIHLTSQEVIPAAACRRSDSCT